MYELEVVNRPVVGDRIIDYYNREYKIVSVIKDNDKLLYKCIGHNRNSLQLERKYLTIDQIKDKLEYVTKLIKKD